MINKCFPVTLVAIAVLLFSQVTASAQRTMSGQYFAGVDYLWPGNFPGARVTFGQYLQSSSWRASVIMRDYAYRVSTGDDMMYSDIVAEGMWDYRFLSTRNRMLCLYAGAGVFLGYEMYDTFSRLPDYVDPGLGDGCFLYGISAGLGAELFVLRRAALLLGCEAPVNFSSSVERLHWEVSAGIRINL